ncbi:peroxisome biosynthesis protein-like protein (PAS1/Peroxin-1) [Westerdykella ornata]|uniref:Peroxisomal ATPase PEX1 n=1 Tax=Westerdykella ornata TaxID=318751 RepID=A0A6A6JVN9_WESOR|nr:peroxisome biosynthesis protein-like protein (PAS1/Peroxin-1) [Westerdykella ornata]KAF2280670.1 peroxisome biosynthesis protein-like protein (PAS1/Peroxin-1) [Westerdykella ornata]
MAPAVKKPAGQVVQAEVALLQSLKNCFVNLPPSLVSVLVNANAIAQNVVVELSYRQASPAGTVDARNPNPSKSVFLGWTGMQSKRRIAPVVTGDGLSSARGGPPASQDVQCVEVDATFARLIGLNEGQKVGVSLHLDPPQAHTINIEPLTPVDWEMIELHAQFLELNFLSQIRALPNPQAGSSHPLTLHLSPTTTANIIVTSVTPAPPAGSSFVKISPDAEVIVAPKTRQKTERASTRESRSVGGASRKSGKSSASTVRRRSGREDHSGRGALFLRGLDRGVVREWFDEEEDTDIEGLRVWVDKDLLLTKALRGVTWASVAVVKPAGLQEPVDMSQSQEQEKVATRVVAKLGAWEDAPDSRHIVLSTDLCRVLGVEGMVGGLVRLEGAPSQASRPSTLKTKESGKPDSKEQVVKAIKILPFSAAGSQSNAALKFGGESKLEREEAIQRLKSIYGRRNGLLDGPVSDGMLLPPPKEPVVGWEGGIVRFEPAQDLGSVSWVLFPERKPTLELGQAISRPSTLLKGWQQGEALPAEPPHLVGIESPVEQVRGHLAHHSSVLLTGGLGSGKSTCAQLLAHQLRTEYLFNTVYFPCRKLVTDETRVATIRESLTRLFASAAWGARPGGNAVVILDDLDKLCPVETELQVGNENGRSRQLSEMVISIVRQYCTMDSGVVLLATAQGKESLNNVVVGGHIVREIVSLKAPNKEGRRKVLEMLAYKDEKTQANKPNRASSGPTFSPPSSASRPDSAGNQSQRSHSDETDGFVVDTSIDFLDLAGQTDGYMPGDLVLLTSRARNEALIRSVSDAESGPVSLTREDYINALSGFTPASLRNVTLQSSTTRWDSIGGLHETRQILLETLQYPTTYGPIFAQCPLRLRSGLLLYGYPGCGKTLLASAVAGECGLNFISVKGPEILNKYIGASEKSVRDLFERAEAARPCVLFFDEFDSIAPKRGHDSTGVTDRVVNQLLTQMDGAEGLSGVYVLAATSRPDLIDPALLRPGRLDKSLICDLPGLEERIDILKAVTGKLHLAPSVLGTGNEGQNLREIARRTEGYSGADLQAVVYNAQLEAIHDVLGETELGDPTKSDAGKKNGASNGVKVSGKEKGIPEFTHFRFGDKLDADGDENAHDPAPSSLLTERAMIASRIADLQAMRRKLKSQHHIRPSSREGVQGAGAPSKGQEGVDGSRKDPEIQWKHIESSLATTRSSISAQERRRLEGIYREFTEGRNGDLPSGQGGAEIGGRTSLM